MEPVIYFDERGRLVRDGEVTESVPLSADQLPVWEDSVVAGEFLRKRERPAPGAARVVKVQVDQGDVDLYPALVDFLTANEWPDGTQRVPGGLMVFCDQGRLKACLSDKANGLVLFVTIEALALVLEACEDALRDDGADWRESKQATGRR